MRFEALVQRGNFWCFLAEVSNREGAGFAEVAIRDDANGCVSRPVAFPEGIWVKQRFRRQGIGARLVRTIEAFLVASGFNEPGFDALIDGQESHSAHRAWDSVRRRGLSIFARGWKRRLANQGNANHRNSTS